MNTKPTLRQPVVSRVGVSLLVLAFAGLLCVPRADAQPGPNPPERMTYQGYLVDANGAPLGATSPKNYDVIFRIWKSESGAAAADRLWTEQQTVTVDKGYFSVLLGEGSSIGESRPDLSTIFSGPNASDRWVGITVKGIGAGGGDATILPRLRLLTSPYSYLATRAVTADKVDGGSLITGTVPDARLSPNVALRAGGNTFSGNQEFTAGDLLLDNGDKGRMRAKNASGAYEYFLWPRNSDNIMYLNYGSGGFRIRNNNSAETMFLTSDNSVGIGTTTPQGRLEVKDGRMIVNGGGGIAIDTSAFTGLGFQYHPGTGEGAIMSAYNDGYGFLSFYTKEGFGKPITRRMTIDNLGKVGIGTTAPATTLHVRGGGAQLRLENSDNNTFWNIYSESTPNTGHLLLTPNSGVGAWISRVNGNHYSLSDLRLKKDVTGLGDVLNRVLELRPVSFRYKTASEDSSKTIGFVAQEVEPLFPEFVSEANGYKGLSYAEMVAVAIGAIQELNQTVIEQKSALDEQTAKVDRLEQEVANLKKQFALESVSRDERLAALERQFRAQETQTASARSAN